MASSSAVSACSTQTIYSVLLEELRSFRSLAPSKQEAWFRSIPLREKLLQKHNLAAERFSYVRSQNYALALDCLLGLCVSTAPLALTMLAPAKSYESKIKAILHFDNIGASPESIHACYRSDIDDLEKVLNRSVPEGQGFSVLCLLYEGWHGFLIEKRSDTCCVIYQSNLHEYNFLEFLADEEKQIEWTPQELMEAIKGILSKVASQTDRVACWGKLFFAKASRSFSEGDQECKAPLYFLKTKPYQLF